MGGGLITAAEAAQRLEITKRRILALIKANRLPAVKLGNQYVINEDDLAKIKDRPAGRPKTRKS